MNFDGGEYDLPTSPRLEDLRLRSGRRVLGPHEDRVPPTPGNGAPISTVWTRSPRDGPASNSRGRRYDREAWPGISGRWRQGLQAASRAHFVTARPSRLKRAGSETPRKPNVFRTRCGGAVEAGDGGAPPSPASDHFAYSRSMASA